LNGVLRQSPTSPVASNFGCSTRKFLGTRSGGSRYHSGVDVYASAGTPVIATEAGRVVNAYAFYENVCCVIVQTDSGLVINYGEINCNYVVRTGQRVTAGQRVGSVGELVCCNPMLHFEMYRQGTTANIASYPGNISPAVRNPTEYLLHVQQNGL
jgi:murein DD-endopeptidase MepM/ murein hydrolase activator NlpD